MTRAALLGTALLMLGPLSSADAHHSRAMFDMSRNITFRGVVTEYRWQDPHSHIAITVAPGAADRSTVGEWDVEASAISIMTTRGFDRTTFKKGDPIVIVAHPRRDASKQVLLFYVVMPDGRRLYRAQHRYDLEVENP